MSPTELQLVPTDVLIKELLGRFDTAVFAGEREGARVPGHVLSSGSWIGSFSVAMGLCSRLLRKISDEDELCISEHSDDGVDDE